LKYFDEQVYKEIFIFNQYTNTIDIEENDLVLDLGCSKGYLYFKCVEQNKNVDYIGVDASISNIQDFINNLTPGLNPVLLNLAIDDSPKVLDFQCMFHPKKDLVPTITFPNLLKLINRRIDFFKFDIEGDEKYIFQDYNLFKSRICKFAGEIHFRSPLFPREEVYDFLNKIKEDPLIDFDIFSLDSINITENYWSNRDYYDEILINGQIT